MLPLFSPSEAKTSAQKQAEGDKRRILDIQKLLADKYKELETVEGYFNASMERQRKSWEEEKQKNELALAPLRKEVEELEERRIKALIPLVNKEEEWEAIVRALRKREDSAEKREVEARGLSEALVRKLDDVSEREIQVSKKERELSRRESGIKLQEQTTKIGSESLTRLIVETRSKIDSEEKSLAERIKKVSRDEEDLTEREKSLRSREIDVETKEILYRNYPFTSPIHGPR